MDLNLLLCSATELGVWIPSCWFKSGHLLCYHGQVARPLCALVKGLAKNRSGPAFVKPPLDQGLATTAHRSNPASVWQVR